MGEYKEVKGDLIALAKKGEFDVIAHGCNCFCTMGAGLAPQMAKAFGADKFHMEGEAFDGEMGKLGCIDWEDVYLDEDGKRIEGLPGDDDNVVTVVNCYSQYGFGRNHKEGSVAPLDYEALALCFRKMNNEFAGEHIGLPAIGAGLAGGSWEKVKTLIQQEFTKCDVTVVIYEPS